ncbi:uncharacterized protein LOC113470899 [Diaphorina citri]|uniref:Uncharacterized protein LOC113470899 n=1 Tax=Diaphorina citri TaxID=121845 RepID=A0A3Q0JAK8_DIACI|nr:uncharacterized protein LOC113470899 [Diaphorina citri]
MLPRKSLPLKKSHKQNPKKLKKNPQRLKQNPKTPKKNPKKQKKNPRKLTFLQKSPTDQKTPPAKSADLPSTVKVGRLCNPSTNKTNPVSVTFCPRLAVVLL